MTQPSELEAYLVEQGARLGLYRGPDFLALPLPERLPILGPWLVEQSLTMIYAERGLGKSLLMMAMGLAVAKGEPFLGYAAGHPQRVLMVDGEMPPREAQKRLELLSGGYAPENFMCLSATQAGEDWLDLNDPYGRMQLLEVIQKVQPKMLILDNKSTLMPPNRENDAESWVEMQKWFIGLRKMGLAVVLVHHSGKGGQQRGTSMVEVTLDTVIKLGRAPTDGHTPNDGARFVLTFEKNRHFYGEDAQPLLVELVQGEGLVAWRVQPYREDKVAQAVDLSKQGYSQRQIATALGVSAASVNAYLKSA